MLIRIRVHIYKFAKAKAIEKYILDRELAQNVSIATEIVGDFVVYNPDQGYLHLVQNLQKEYGCEALVEVK